MDHQNFFPLALRASIVHSNYTHYLKITLDCVLIFEVAPESITSFTQDLVSF